MGLWEWIAPILVQTLAITLIIFALLIIVEFLAIRFSATIERHFVRRRWMQYILGSAAGTIPGCTGVFTVDAAYMAGISGFGGIVAATVATCGDEAFVLFAQLAMPASPLAWQTLALLLASLFVLGILAGWLADVFAKITNMRFCQKCVIKRHEGIDTSSASKIPVGHFIREHIWNHIIRKHIPNIVIWLFVSLVVVKALNQSFDLERIVTQNRYILILAAAAVGILPISGPNLLFVSMFARGMLPFSVMLANSIVQDGHGLLPVIGFSVEDGVKIKAFNLMFGLVVAYILAFVGI